MNWVISLGVIILFSAQALSQVSISNNSTYVMCRSQKNVRTIRVANENESGGACTTFYTKLGKDKVVGTGNRHSSCYKFLNNIRENLEKANWKCKDISRAKIHSGQK